MDRWICVVMFFGVPKKKPLEDDVLNVVTPRLITSHRIDFVKVEFLSTSFHDPMNTGQEEVINN